MNKTYHFLAGLPRSGNTLLSALFNQNPNIYSSPISPLPDLMWNFANTCNNIEQINRNTENQIKAKMFLSSFINNYYKKIEKPVVIDREKVWGTPANLDIIKQYITPTPKIIFTVRDILEIIASFVKMDADYLKNGAYNSGYYIANYRSEKDLVAEHLMEPNGDIGKGLLSLASAFYPENKGMFHIVEYNNLVFNPEETMAGIYDFLEMPHYQHNFNKIQKVEKDNDEVLGLPKDLHDIRKSLSNSSTSIDILSDYIKHKYSNMEFWRERSTMKIRGRDF
jgi:sulfotransferase